MNKNNKNNKAVVLKKNNNNNNKNNEEDLKSLIPAKINTLGNFNDKADPLFEDITLEFNNLIIEKLTINNCNSDTPPEPGGGCNPVCNLTPSMINDVVPPNFSNISGGSLGIDSKCVNKVLFTFITLTGTTIKPNILIKPGITPFKRKVGTITETNIVTEYTAGNHCTYSLFAARVGRPFDNKEIFTGVGNIGNSFNVLSFQYNINPNRLTLFYSSGQSTFKAGTKTSLIIQV